MDIKKIIEIRKQIHMYPEGGFKEFKTHKLVKDTLLSFGYLEEEMVVCAVTGLFVNLKGTGEESQEEKEVSRGSGEEKTETSLLPAPDSTIHPMPRARGITLESGYIGVNRNLCLDLFPSLTSSSSQS